MTQSKHLCIGSKKKANLRYTFSNVYRENGHKYISGSKHRKARYADNKTIKNGLKEKMDKGDFRTVADAGLDTHADRYHFDYGRNFVGMGPYENRGHHLLPQEFWSKLSSDEMSILKQLDYDINNGENIIFLPYDIEGYPVHKLPMHNSNHREYSEEVIKNAEATRKDLAAEASKETDCEKTDPPTSIVDDLMALQKDFWSILAKSTQGNVNDVTKMSDKKTGL